MFVKYIDNLGNWQEFDERTQPGWRNNYIQDESGIRRVKPVEPKKVKVVKTPEPVEAIEEPVMVEEVVETVEEDYTPYKEYLKSIKLKWYGLLKGEKIKIKALENGYPG